MSLVDIKSKKRIEGEVNVIIKSYKEIDNEEGGYAELNLLINGERDYKWCVFPSQYQYLADGLRNQLVEDDSEPDLLDLLDTCKETEFKLWFSWNTKYNRYNISLYAPRETITEEVLEMI